MRKQILLLLFAVLLIGIPLVSAVQNQFESFEDTDNTFDINSPEAYSQSIHIRNQSFSVSNVSIYFSTGSGAKPNVTLIIKAVNSTGEPTGGNLTQGSHTFYSIAGAGSWINISVPSYSLTNNTNYSIIILTNDTTGISLGIKYTEDLYLFGHASTSVNRGVSWTINYGGVTGYDLGFRLYGGGSDFTQAVVSLKAPVNNTITQSTTYFFSANYTGTIDNWRNFTNATLYLWYQNGSLFNTNYSANNDDLNSTNLSFSNIPVNTFLWNYKVCGTNSSNNKPCFWDILGNRTFNEVAFTESLVSYTTSSYETKRETFLLNITANQTVSSATFVYAGVSYFSSLTSFAGGNYTLNSSIDIPLTSSNEVNNSFYWTVNFASFSQTSSSYGQNVSRTYLINCNSTYYTPYINYSFKDEVTNGVINASIPTSSFTYWIQGGSGEVNRTYTFINNSENWAYAFCFYPNSSSINMLDSIQYKQEDYPQRISSAVRSLSNSVLSKVLYLLSSTDGIFVTFQVLNSIGSPISSVDISVNRTIGSSIETIVSGSTDQTGLVTFWLNPDFLHTFLFSKSGFDTETQSLFPTQSSYTMVMGGGISNPAITDYAQGITIKIQPTNDFLRNNTNYNFNYTITTNDLLFDSWGFVLRYGNGSTITTQTSTTDTGGILTYNTNTQNQTRIIMEYYYVVNSTYINKTRIWQISKTNSFSIFHFFEDLNLYLGANIFGINGEDGDDTFGRALLSVLILVLTAGTLSYRYGIASEQAVLGMIFGIVLFLNTVGFIPNPSFLTGTGVSLGDFVVLITGIITVALIYKGEQR